MVLLLNMALLNLGSSDPNLRTAAYNLLCALTSTFDLKIEGHLLETAGLCIPSNNTIFIKSVSETLARNEPHLTLEFLEECIQGFSAMTSACALPSPPVTLLLMKLSSTMSISSDTWPMLPQILAWMEGYISTSSMERVISLSRMCATFCLLAGPVGGSAESHCLVK